MHLSAFPGVYMRSGRFKRWTAALLDSGVVSGVKQLKEKLHTTHSTFPGCSECVCRV